MLRLPAQTALMIFFPPPPVSDLLLTALTGVYHSMACTTVYNIHLFTGHLFILSNRKGDTVNNFRANAEVYQTAGSKKSCLSCQLFTLTHSPSPRYVMNSGSPGGLTLSKLNRPKFHIDEQGKFCRAQLHICDPNSNL